MDRALTVEYGRIAVSWRADLDGGGRAFGQDYVPIVAQLFGRVGRVLEVCAGPGFIGFSLLAHGLCDSLALVDINPEAVAYARHTVSRNGLDGQVCVYESNVLDAVPDTERFDLVVGNPPHFAHSPMPTPSLITDDPEWHFHRRFYRDVGRVLAPAGCVLIQENSEGSRPEDFYPMITEAGLEHRRTFWYLAGQASPSIYYLWSVQPCPGLVSYRQPATVTVGLTSPESRVDVAGPGPLILRPHNRTGGAVRIRLVDDAGHDQLWVPLAEIAAGAALELPPLALRPGVFRLIDRDAGHTYARLCVSGST